MECISEIGLKNMLIRCEETGRVNYAHVLQQCVVSMSRNKLKGGETERERERGQKAN